MVGLIFCGDLKYCPYINRYIEQLEKNKTSYKVYFWNRGNFSLNLPSNYIYYGASSKLEKSKWRKIYDFTLFRKWIKEQIKQDKPDKIIALSTLTGVILGKILYSNSQKYIFDIRDYSYEHIKFFYHIEKKVIENSSFTTISSKGFEEFLPKYKYVIAHNFNRKDIDFSYKFKKSNDKIKFVWNGVMRYFDYQRQYLDLLKNDDRFEIVFHGDGPELKKYQDYCNSNNFNNVFFTGAYDNSKKNSLLKDANILNNCYGYLENAGSKLKYAVSNRFYDGIIYHIPQLVEPDGYKTDMVISNKIGMNFVAENDFADKLYNYYQQIDENNFNKSCDNLLKKVLIEDDTFIRKINEFIK